MSTHRSSLIAQHSPLKVFVTGGAGYIGSHVAKDLAGAGRRIVVYDDLSAGHRGAVRWCDLVVGDYNYVFDPRVLTNHQPYFAAYIKFADFGNFLDKLDLDLDKPDASPPPDKPS